MNGLVARQDESLVQFSPEQVLSQVKMIQELMSQVMIKDQHYGTIPGTPKPTLYKAGAEKLNFTFRLAPKFEIKKSDLKDGHREYEIVCELFHINSSLFFGAGVGSCSTMEVKYRYREEKRRCPICMIEAIIKGKQEYGGGWVCFKKQKGCGAKFKDDDTTITDQKIGRIENPDLADQYNTVLKMAKKRALVDATITACAASDIFTQDMEDVTIKVENGKKEDPPNSGDDKKAEKVIAEKAQEVVTKIMDNIKIMGEYEAPENAIPAEMVKICKELFKKHTTYENSEQLLKQSYKSICYIHGKLKKVVAKLKEAPEPDKAEPVQTENQPKDGDLPF